MLDDHAYEPLCLSRWFVELLGTGLHAQPWKLRAEQSKMRPRFGRLHYLATLPPTRQHTEKHSMATRICASMLPAHYTS